MGPNNPKCLLPVPALNHDQDSSIIELLSVQAYSVVCYIAPVASPKSRSANEQPKAIQEFAEILKMFTLTKHRRIEIATNKLSLR
jgi:hypothetical protein